MIKSLLRRDDRGIGAVEFALVAPVLISFVIGISQLGKVFFASADMKNALAAGARVASVYPVPSDATILAAVNERLVRSEAGTQAEAVVVHGTENGNPFIEIQMDYTVPLEFIFFDTPPVAMNDSRKVFTQVENANTTKYVTPAASGGVTSGGVTSGGVTSGGDTSSGVTSGGVTSGGVTSGGVTSGGVTSGGVTSGGVTSSGAPSSTSAGGPSSSGNASSSGNNGSSGHDHGNCNKKC